MGQKLQHTSPDLLIHPGESILEIIDDRGINQKELAIRTGFTEKHISTVINGKKSISAKLALSLESALDIPATFWKNLQSNYDLELEKFNEANNISKEELNIAKILIKPIEILLNEQINSSNRSHTTLKLRRILGVSNLTAINKLNPAYYRKQFSDDTNEYVMYAFQYLSEKKAELQDTEFFNYNLLKSRLNEIKAIMMENPSEHIKLVTKILNECGIAFVVNKNVPKAPINGLTTKTKTNKLMIAMTIRNKYVDIFWFSLFHELAHIINKDYLEDQNDFKRVVRAEQLADDFAKEKLIDPKNYQDFLNLNNFTNTSIINFALANNILPSIVVGRLMKEGFIDWSQNSLREQYEFVE